jgi:hypothetical protein
VGLLFTTYGSPTHQYDSSGGFPTEHVHELQERLSQTFADSPGSPPKKVNYSNVNDSDDLSEIWRLLEKTKLHIRGAKAKRILIKAIDKLKPLISTNNPLLETKISANICPERFFFPANAENKWEFQTENCSYSSPISRLLTITLNCVNMTSRERDTLVEAVHAYDPHIRIVMAVSNDGARINSTTDKTYLKEVLLNPYLYEGVIWNSLVAEVNTSYVLIGRNLNWYTADGNLERLVRELERLEVGVASGAYRTPDGHWRMGCQQSALANYRLVYEIGYFESRHECVYCDYVEGAFVSSAKLLRQFPFSKTLRDGVFNDFFLLLHLQNYESIVCPDVMFYSVNTTISSATELMPFMAEWQVYDMSLRHM